MAARLSPLARHAPDNRRFPVEARVASCNPTLRRYGHAREGLEQVPIDSECPVEDTEDIDRVGVLDHVGDALMSVKQDADVSVWLLPVAVPGLWKFSKDLRFETDGFNGSGCRGRTVEGDVVVDVTQPSLGFGGPCQLCHVLIRRPISSWLIVLPASESASPRSIILANVNSRSSSS